MYAPAADMFRCQLPPAEASLCTKPDDCQSQRVNFTTYLILTMVHVTNEQPVPVEAQIPTHNGPCGIHVERSVTVTDCLRVLSPWPAIIIPRLSIYSFVISHRRYTSLAFDSVVSGFRRGAYEIFALFGTSRSADWRSVPDVA